jgi:hypothetical protein
MPEKRCKVCLVEHDEEIHAATLSLHEWLRELLLQKLYETVEEQPAVA